MNANRMNLLMENLNRLRTNHQIASLMKVAPGNAAEMTHNLSLLGDGDMGCGIRNLWADGFGSGMISATAILGGASLIYWGITHKERILKEVEALDIAFNNGYAAGKWHEQEHPELKEKDETQTVPSTK